MRNEFATKAALKRWSGDSKVVNDNGEPLVVYHGTDRAFTTFRGGRDLGLHFGDEDAANTALWSARPDYSETPVTGENIIPVYLAISNPLRLEDTFGSTFHSIEDTIRNLVRQGVISKTIAPGLVGDREALRTNDPKVISDAWARVQGAIEGAGYDGVVYENEIEGGSDSYIAFRPEQIKSAIGNSGIFDPESADFCDAGSAPEPIRSANSEGEFEYTACEAQENTLTPLGYTFDWGFDAEPFNLRQLSQSERNGSASEGKVALEELDLSRLDDLVSTSPTRRSPSHER